MASGLLMELMLWRLAARAGVGMARRATGDSGSVSHGLSCNLGAVVWIGR